VVMRQTCKSFRRFSSSQASCSTVWANWKIFRPRGDLFLRARFSTTAVCDRVNLRRTKSRFRDHTKSVQRFIRPFTFNSQDSVLLRLLGVNVHHFVKERIMWLETREGAGGACEIQTFSFVPKTSHSRPTCPLLGRFCVYFQ
jgi:hypothetical protein